MRMEGWRVRIGYAGSCKQLEALAIRGGRWRSIRFPALFALLEHPRHGTLLFDTGYSERFEAATARWPYALYRWMTPVQFSSEQSAAAQLRAWGKQPEAIQTVIVSHFHADHYAGLSDFPDAQLLCTGEAYRSVRNLQGWGAVRAAFLPQLLPRKLISPERLRLLEHHEQTELPEQVAPFTHGYDLYGDGSLWAIELPGHATGQMGLYVVCEDGAPLLFGADASWSMQAVRENRLPHSLAFLLFDGKGYKETFAKLVELHRREPELSMVYSHCSEGWR